MSKPILLDLFCCEGGAARGYQQAGFHVVGVDMEPRFAKRYAGDEFICANVIDFMEQGMPGVSPDAIHASPPCQRYSITNAARKKEYPDLVGSTRDLLQRSGLPYVIENVVGAPLVDPVTLCWSMFREAGSVLDDDGTPLRMERHRLFEASWDLEAPGECCHDRSVQVAGSYGGARRDKWEAKHVRKGGYVPSAEVQSRLLEIDWMTQHGMHQSIPPMYSEWVGRSMMRHMGRRA